MNTNITPIIDNINLYRHLMNVIPGDKYNDIFELNNLVFDFNTRFNTIVNNLYYNNREIGFEIFKYYNPPPMFNVNPNTIINNINNMDNNTVTDIKVNNEYNKPDNYDNKPLEQPVITVKKRKHHVTRDNNIDSKIRCNGYYDDTRNKYYRSGYCEKYHEKMVKNKYGRMLKLVCCRECFQEYGKNKCSCGVYKSREFKTCKRCVNGYTEKCPGYNKNCLGNRIHDEKYCRECIKFVC